MEVGWHSLPLLFITTDFWLFLQGFVFTRELKYLSQEGEFLLQEG